MSNNKTPMVCPVEIAGGLDNSLRKFLQNPQKILKPYIKTGMTVLDLGCGPGFFTIEIAKLLTGSGKVIAADLQEGMLYIVRQKIAGTPLEGIVEFHKCSKTEVGLKKRVDFVLAFYMIHEVPDQERLFKELIPILNPNGRILIIEPKIHVSKKAFDEMTANLTRIGFKVLERPKVFFSNSVLVGI